MPIRGAGPLEQAYEQALPGGGGSTSWNIGYNDPFEFLYPESEGSQQYEVWQNPQTGEFQRRNYSQLPGWSAPTPPLPGPSTYYPPTSGMAPSEAEEGVPFSQFPIPIYYPQQAPQQGVSGAPEYAQQPSGFEQFAFEQGARLPFQFIPGAETAIRAVKGEELIQGEGVGRALDIAATIVDVVPFLGAVGDLGRGAANILRASEAFSSVAAPARRLALSEQGFLRTPWGNIPLDKIDQAEQMIKELDLLDDEMKSLGKQMSDLDIPPEVVFDIRQEMSGLFAIRREIPRLLKQLAVEEGAGLRLPFSKPQPQFFHATSEVFEPSTIAPQAGEPIFLAPTKKAAEGFVAARAAVGGKPATILGYNITPEARVLDLRSKPEAEVIKFLDEITVGGTVSKTDAIRKLGYDVVHATQNETLVANPEVLRFIPNTAVSRVLADEAGFLRLSQSAGISPQTSKALGASPSMDWGDITRTVQEATTNRIAGLERSAKKLGGDELNKIIDEFNQVGSVVTKAAERSRMVYEKITDIAATAGVRASDMPIFQDDVSRYLNAQTAATWRKLHPRAADRPFGAFGSSKDAAQWLTNYRTAPAHAEIEAAARVVADDHKRIRDALYASGGLTRKAYNELTNNYPWYNPLKYTNIANDAALGNADALHTLGSLRAKIHELANDVPTHGNVLDPMESVFLANSSVERFVANNNFVRKALDVVRRDPDMVGLVRKLQPNQTHNLDTERAFVLFNNGAVERWAAPKWVSGELERTIAHDSDNEIIGLVNTLNKWWRTGAIEQNPSFIATNFILDHLNAYARTGTVPGTAIPEMIRYLRGVNTDPTLRAFRLAGAEQSKFFSNATQAEKLKLARSLMTETQRTKNLTDGESIGRHIVSFLPRMGRATEQGQRLKAFENTLDKSLTGWRSMSPIDVAATPQAKRAATEALESIINYHRGGWLTRNLDRVIPFANVAVQGTLLPLRIVQSPQGRRRVADLAGLFTGLTWYNNSYPENADVPAYIRYGSVYVMLPTEEYTVEGRPKPNYMVLSPALRDWVPLQGTMAWLIENFISQSPTAGYGLMGQVLQNAPTGVGPGPVFDLASILLANYNMFKERPVVPESEQNLPAELQFGITTPRTYKVVGDALNMSPRTLQAITESLGTGPAKTAVGASDWILDTFFPEAVNEQTKLALERIQAAPPEVRETLLTLLPRDLRDAVQIQSFKRETALPLVGPIAKRFRPEVGGELERVGPRSAEVRTADMTNALGTDTIRTLRELSLATPVMNNTVSFEGHYTKLDDRQLEAAHNIYRDYLAITIVPMLADPRFAEYMNRDRAGAEKAISMILEKTETTIKERVLSATQRAALRMP